MNWLDAVLLLILAVSVVRGFRMGLSRQVIGLVSVVAAIVLGLWMYGLAGAYLEPYLSSRRMANFGGFLLVFFAVLLAGSLAGFLIGKLLKITGLSFFDRLLGAGFGALRGTLISVALILGLMAFSAEGKPPQSVVRSHVAPYAVGAARVFAALAPHEMREGFRRSYGEVKSAWQTNVAESLRATPEVKKGPEAKKGKDERRN
jgi:membrane protein required for colicin V production